MISVGSSSKLFYCEAADESVRERELTDSDSFKMVFLLARRSTPQATKTALKGNFLIISDCPLVVVSVVRSAARRPASHGDIAQRAGKLTLFYRTWSVST